MSFQKFSLVFSCLAVLLSVYHALKIEDNRPGAIPILTHEVNNMPGGWFLVAQQGFGALGDELNRKIQELEATDAIPGSPRHKLIKIRHAISQVVAGFNKKVVFTVGQLNNAPPLEEINHNGQYGECYFKLFYPLKSHTAQVQEHRCVKITKQQANQ
uniref:Uncharacterized protein n=1 Tax=Romanomermis culicivorax TaxID=13658 RepID=A0A915I4D4_ROMCU